MTFQITGADGRRYQFFDATMDGVPVILADRRWQCPRCGVWHDRDINAAQNILHRALVG